MSGELLLRRSCFVGPVLAALVAMAAGPPACAAKFNRKVDIGKPAPNWKGLEGVDGARHSLEDYKQAKVLVVAFLCNQCPVSQFYEERFIHFVNDYRSQGVRFVAISCSLLPPDRLEKMKEHARDAHFNFDYLCDPSQQTGKDYGATVTPQIFVLDRDRKIAYMGRFDDNMEPDKVHRRFAHDAVRALLAGKQPDPSETRATGCGIEYGKRQYPLEGSGGE
jgi:peroxiredoxin